MILESPDVIARLDKLEQENQRLKRWAVVLLVIAGSVFLMGQAAPSKRTVEAQKFDLVDSAGNVRAELAVLPGGAALRFFDTKGGQSPAGKMLLELGGSESSGPPTGLPPLPYIHLYGSDSKMLVALTAGETGSALSLYGSDSKRLAQLTTGGDDGPALLLTDDQGFKARLGRVSLQKKATGESSETSAASLVLFDKAGNVIWRAP